MAMSLKFAPSYFASNVRRALSALRRAPALLIVIGLAFSSAAASAQVSYGGIQSNIPGPVSGGSWAGAVGVASDTSGNIYVGEYNTPGSAIIKVDGTTHGLSTLLTGSISCAGSPITIDNPQLMITDSSNNLYIANEGTGQILVYSITSSTCSNYFPAASVFALALSSSGDLYYGSNVTGAVGKIPSVATAAPGTVPTPVISSGLNSVTGLAFAPATVGGFSAGDLIVSNHNTGTVYQYTASSSYASRNTVATGYTNSFGLMFDAANNLYLSVTGSNKVYKFTPGTSYSQASSFPVVPYALGAEGVGSDPGGNLYFTAYAGGGSQSTVTELCLSSTCVAPVVEIGSSSSTYSVNFQLAAGTTVSSFTMMDQGLTGTQSEFNAPTSDSNPALCSALTYPLAAAAVCDVDFAFKPTSPGAHNGAVVALNGSTVLATAYFSGIGKGPQVVFPPYTNLNTLLAPATLSAPYGVTSDHVTGNLFLADTGNKRILELPYNSGTNTYASAPTQIASGYSWTNPTGIAIDGAGNLFVADSSKIVEIPWTGSSYGTPVSVASVGSISDVAVDGGGNLYYVGSAASATKLTYESGAWGSPTSIGSGLSGGSVRKIAVDGAGNLYISDNGAGNFYKETLGVGGSYTQSLLASAGIYSTGMTVDAAGDVYLADYSDSAVTMLPACSSCSSGYGPRVTVASVSGAESLTLTPTGELITNEYGQGALVELDRVTPPSLIFPTSTVVGSADSNDDPLDFSILNIGNDSLSVSVPGSGTNPSFAPGFAYDSSSSCPSVSASGSPALLSSGASCTYGVDFIPVASGVDNGTAVLTDNNLNAHGSTQTVSLSGNGLPQVSQLAWGTAPASTLTAGGNTGTVVVDEDNSSSQIVTSATDLITLKVTGPNGYSQTYTATAVAGVATFNLSSVLLTTPGAYSYQASIVASPSVTPVTAPETVNKATPSVVLISTPNPVYILTSVTYTATVTGIGSVGVPSGNVTFFDGVTSLGTATLNTSGVATLAVAPTVTGTHNITAVYNGNTSYNTATSNIIPELAQDFSVAVASGGSGTAIVNPGGTANYSLVVSPLAGPTFPAAVTLTTSGGPASATITLTPTTAAAGAGATNLALKVVTANIIVLNNPEGLGRKLAPLTLAFLLLPLLGFRRGRRTWVRHLSVLLLLAGALAASAGLTGCTVPTGYFGQAPKSFTITVTGTAGALTHSTSVTLTIE